MHTDMTDAPVDDKLKNYKSGQDRFLAILNPVIGQIDWIQRSNPLGPAPVLELPMICSFTPLAERKDR
jgi:hypothetical protein